MNNPQFLVHNSHLDGLKAFEQRDPHWRMLEKQIYAYQPKLLDELPKNTPGIYTITGGRQIGKTTLAKQWMHKLLVEGINPKSIAYFTGEVIVDHLSLIQQLQDYLSKMPSDQIKYIIIDEVTYIINWDMGIKFLADAGLLENVMLILTGSDTVIIQEARMRFPGRRGRSDQVDYQLYPLSFYEVLDLTKVVENLDEVLNTDTPNEIVMEKIYKAFNNYLIHGGYLTAINNYAESEHIDKALLDVYSDWIRGDIIKRGKSDQYCREFFTAMRNRLNSQVSWAALAKDFAIEHHSTVAAYAHLLMSMDAIYIQQALIEDKLLPAPKKAKKLIFTDPFIFHAIRAWLTPTANPFKQQIIPAIQDPIIVSYLVEACVTSQIRRWYPTYYIKAEGEVDIAYIKDNKFWPIEVKWTQQLRAKDLKQVQKYPNGIILAKQRETLKINHLTSYPLPWYLAKLAYKILKA
ncbi:MAG: ATP-binding protein [Gammaproteobacteria bacterium]|nr:ATP-binding protein [Gammaproteobacteria bacterium]